MPERLPDLGLYMKDVELQPKKEEKRQRSDREH